MTSTDPPNLADIQKLADALPDLFAILEDVAAIHDCTMYTTTTPDGEMTCRVCAAISRIHKAAGRPRPTQEPGA